MRGGRVFLVKECPICGRSEVLIYGNASRYRDRRELGAADGFGGCALDCLRCSHRQAPGIVFVDVTNRCNLTCSVCMNNVPSMGFVYEPPLDYFRRIFDHLAERDPLPSLDIFGGEPTVREDLFDVIGLAHSYGFTTRVATNGLKLADEDYCHRLVDTGTDILFSYDGSNADAYRIIRGDARWLDVKRRALDNLATHGHARVVIVALIVKGHTDDQIPALLDFCHERRDHVHGLLLAQLAHTWEDTPGSSPFGRIRADEIEAVVERALGATAREFIPAGFPGRLSAIGACLGVAGSAFAGAHPDCETTCLAVSDGCKYVAFSHVLRRSLPAVARGFLAAEHRLARGGPPSPDGAGTPRRWMQMAQLAPLLARSVRVSRLFRGAGPSRLRHVLGFAGDLIGGAGVGRAVARHTRLGEALTVRVMPIQDDATVQTDRTAACPVVSAYVDPQTADVKFMSSCAWRYHNRDLLKRIARAHPRREPAPARRGP